MRSAIEVALDIILRSQDTTIIERREPDVDIEYVSN